MIEFKKGEFIGGKLFGYREAELNTPTDENDLWYNPISDECWIFTIESENNGVGLFSVVDYQIEFIPSITETDAEHYDLFWKSELTLVFNTKETALDFIRNYEGELKDIIWGAYLLFIKEDSYDEIYNKYIDVDGLDEETNNEFYYKLMEFIMKENYSVSSTLATMKSFILNCYRDEIAEEKQLAKLN
jgi:hypothetical protein